MNGRHKQNFQYCIVHSIYVYIYIHTLQDYIEYLQIMTFPNSKQNKYFTQIQSWGSYAVRS